MPPTNTADQRPRCVACDASLTFTLITQHAPDESAISTLVTLEDTKAP